MSTGGIQINHDYVKLANLIHACKNMHENGQLSAITYICTYSIELGFFSCIVYSTYYIVYLYYITLHSSIVRVRCPKVPCTPQQLVHS